MIRWHSLLLLAGSVGLCTGCQTVTPVTNPSVVDGGQSGGSTTGGTTGGTTTSGGTTSGGSTSGGSTSGGG